MYDSLGWANIERHTNAIRAWLYERLSQLRHSNSAPILRILGRHGRPDSHAAQGATFNFQILKPNGEVGRGGGAWRAACLQRMLGSACTERMLWGCLRHPSNPCSLHGHL